MESAKPSAATCSGEDASGRRGRRVALQPKGAQAQRFVKTFAHDAFAVGSLFEMYRLVDFGV
eukprot:4594704-Pleurochrysis_carterae.AAC.1